MRGICNFGSICPDINFVRESPEIVFMPAATFYLLCDFGELFLLLAPKYTHGRARNADIVTSSFSSSSWIVANFIANKVIC